MSILSVAVQSVYAATTGEFVPAELFTPPPKVDSLVLHLEQLQQTIVPANERKAFMQVVKTGFSAKRKTLRNTISAGLHISKQDATELLEGARIVPERRAETLSLDEWKTLYAKYLTR
jgi:16S rRNA (adenine1518-N6/adenine1519-N6)-dimethyltransferase